ncbi:MAG: hypothetical protein JSW40_07445 [Candidatus Omnitrophota bacterium]|nr:MAG: hypothetical protein JSW40_07445 [Candidatus Omnitrophota bacterium]
MKVPKLYNGVAFLIILSLLFPKQALSIDGRLPKRIEKAKDKFIKCQVSPSDKIFLNRLSLALKAQSQLNEATLALFQTISVGKDVPLDSTIKDIEKTASGVMRDMIRYHRTKRIMEIFIRKADLPNGKYLAEQFQDIINTYASMRDISNYIKKDIHGAGTHHHYQVYLRSFEENMGVYVNDILREAMEKYKHAARLAKEYNVEELQDFFMKDTAYFTELTDPLQILLIGKMQEASHTWYKQVVMKVLGLLQKQFQFNSEFSEEITDRLLSVPVPQEPQLPDLRVVSINVTAPHTIRVGTRITIVTEIENDSDLKITSSILALIGPKDFKKHKRIPALLPHQTYKVKWKYVLRSPWEKTFMAIANYKNKAWEGNYNNNRTSRTFDFLLDEDY